ncbi:hypothetical protein [Methylocella silvestris]|uniref:Uncharacterized protein n=1 Tax=Methylocella silvestris TaxID=199596 RepID=A0A2J7TLJ9_METSI|nr:hypothetical protein [Methylocella silvestris]PNG27646.1 hypothetical protein CR492_01660 [Methylocella silvestris]
MTAPFEYNSNILEFNSTELTAVLRDKVAARDAIHAEMCRLEECRARLEPRIHMPASIEAKLDALAAEEATALQGWAESKSASEPPHRGVERARLAVELKEARDIAAAADVAQRSFQAQQTALMTPYAEANRDVHAAIWPVIASNFEAACADLVAKVAAFDAAISRAKGAISYCFEQGKEIGASDHESAVPFFQLGEVLIKRIKSVATPEPVGDVSTWRDMIEAVTRGAAR